MDYKEVDRIFYRDGYRLAYNSLEGGITPSNLIRAIGQLYISIEDLLEAFLRRSEAEGKPVKCGKGCSWCCYQSVFAVTHEFLYIKEHIQTHISDKIRHEILERARKRSRLTINRSVTEQLKLREPCPFLEDGACLIYDVRPMACRIYLSSSEKACRKEYEQPGNEKNFPDLFEFPLRAGRMLNQGFVAFLKQAGLQSVEFPMEQGYTSMVDTDQTFRTWIGTGPQSR
jgi:Fe-S-cluster containining protein